MTTIADQPKELWEAVLGELEGLLSQDPGLEQECKRLARESRLMIELMPMIREARSVH